MLSRDVDRGPQNAPVNWIQDCNPLHEGHSDFPCLFGPSDNLHVAGNVTAPGAFVFYTWVVGSSSTKIIVDADHPDSLPCQPAGRPAGLCGSHPFKDQSICTDEDLKDKWQRCSIGPAIIFSNTSELSFSLSLNDSKKVGMIVDSISIASPSATPSHTQTTPPTTITESTWTNSPAGSAAPVSESNKQTTTSSGTGTITLPPVDQATSQVSASSWPRDVEPATTAPAVSHHSGREHSHAHTIAPAVVVPIAVVFGAVVAFYLWRRRRRLARIAPSALFKGESPEMKPWLPLDAKRSASRQGWD